MSNTFVVLSETVLEPKDAMRALHYLGHGTGEDHDDSTPHVSVVVPADTGRSLIAEVIDDLGLLDFQAAWDAVIQRLRSRPANIPAETILASVTKAFRCVGCEVSGDIAAGNPLPLVRRLLEDGCETQTVVVFSEPQLLEETFQQDWAHQVEDHLQATVLHLYPGEDRIGTS
ncbi:hypothetical protein [Devriesea agamarum]|uniref:hypothetical protein n=1 Tax=Devriesea agamarum TaxID=472569 RepID=UPI00071C2939|nr:hypothetical protein [Devriesea agamarum]